MMIRALPVVDRLERDGRELILVGGEVVLVSVIAVAILRGAGSWIDIGEVTAELVREFGAPGGIDAAGRVAEAVAELEGHLLLETRSESHHISPQQG